MMHGHTNIKFLNRVCGQRVGFVYIKLHGKWKHQLDATILSVYVKTIVHSTRFGCHIHPSSGASNMYNQVCYNLITV